jgi:hypothetical protein
MSEEISQDLCGWINNEKPIWKHALKPCKILRFCPYGPMVELFPLQEGRSNMSCEVFGHDCPVFYHAEMLAEDTVGITDQEWEDWIKESEG